MSEDVARSAIDTSVVHSARRYDYWLGGKDNFAVDRESGDRIAELFPTIRVAAQENRRFLHRAVGFLTAEVGIRQFLDIGTGLPSAQNTHQVAQAIAPESRIVYVDNDPLVMVHARALLNGDPSGATAYLEADVRDPETILTHARSYLDFDRPIGLMLVALLHFLQDTDEPQAHVDRLVRAMPAGSWIVLTHATADHIDPQLAQALLEASRGEFRFRSRTEVASFLDGMQVAEPGIVSLPDWRPDRDVAERPSVADVSWYGAAAQIR